jgi:hypothetical protein
VARRTGSSGSPTQEAAVGIAGGNQLADKLREIGVHIPGNDRAANLLSHIGRDERFQRVKSGTYVLTEWKTRAMSKPHSGSGEEKESHGSADNEGRL